MAKNFCCGPAPRSLRILHFFSVGLIIDPESFFGPNSVLCYYTQWDGSATWFGQQALGTITFFSIMSPHSRCVVCPEYPLELGPSARLIPTSA